MDEYIHMYDRTNKLKKYIVFRGSLEFNFSWHFHYWDPYYHLNKSKQDPFFEYNIFYYLLTDLLSWPLQNISQYYDPLA